MKYIITVLTILLIVVDITRTSAQLDNQPTIIFEGHREGGIRSARFSPDGENIVTTGYDGTMRLWDVTTGEEIRQFSTNLEADQGDPNYQDATYSPDGGKLVAAHGEIAVIFDLKTDLELARFVGHTASVDSVDYSPDGLYAVTASWDSTVRVWDTKTGDEILQINGNPSSGFPKAKFSPDGNVIIVSGGDQRVRLLDATTGGELLQFDGGDSGKVTAVLSPDGQTIISNDGSTLRWWDTITGQKILEREIKFYPLSGGGASGVDMANYSPDGRYIVIGCADETVRILGSTTGEEVYRFPVPNTSVGTFDLNFGAGNAIFSPNGQKILISSLNFLALWDVAILAPVTESRQGVVVSAVEINDSPFTKYYDGVQAGDLRDFTGVVSNEWSPPSDIYPRYLMAFIPRFERGDGCDSYLVEGAFVTVWRFWLDVTVVVTDLTTGQAVGTRDFLGVNPQECRQTEEFQIGPDGPLDKSYIGAANSNGFKSWLDSIVANLPGILSPDSSPAPIIVSTSCTGTIASTSASVNMRNGPGTNFAVVTTVPTNATIQVIGVQGEWYKAQYQNSEGWIAAQLLSLSSSGCDSLPSVSG